MKNADKIDEVVIRPGQGGWDSALTAFVAHQWTVTLTLTDDTKLDCEIQRIENHPHGFGEVLIARAWNATHDELLGDQIAVPFDDIAAIDIL